MSDQPTDLVVMEQGSPEWHAHRLRYRNATETATVLGLSPWQTPYALWLLRTGRKLPVETDAMRHGKTQEPAARRAYEALTGAVMEPQVLVRGDYSASLDGLSLDGRVLLEVKCPVRGRRSDLWQDVLAGVIPLHYRVQVQHQLMVSKAGLGHLFVFDGEQGLIADVEPDPDAWIAIREAWDVFMRHVETDQPPPLLEADTLYRDEPEWRVAAQHFIACKQRCDEAEAELAKAREALLALRRYGREEGAGVQVTRFMRAGTVDYKRVPALAGVDLEPYRGAGREEVRITVV